MKKFSIRNIFGLLAGVIFILLVVEGIYLVQVGMLVDARHKSLQITADSKALLIDTYLNEEKQKIIYISSLKEFKNVALNPNNKQTIVIAKKKINELNSIFPGICITDNKGIVIVAKNDLSGMDYGNQKYYSLENKKIVFEPYYDTIRKNNYLAVVSPIYNNDVTKDKIIGTIVFDLDFETITELMKVSIDSNSEEAYLIDESGLFLSGSKYIGGGNKNGILIQEAKNDEAKACLDDLKKYQKSNSDIEEHEEKIISYLNYIGDDVFGTHAYLKTMTGCVIAEEKVAEVAKFPSIKDIVDIFKNVFNLLLNNK